MDLVRRPLATASLLASCELARHPLTASVAPQLDAFRGCMKFKQQEEVASKSRL
jgi:hypothetical protein